MSIVRIDKHDFDNSKKQIREFSKEVPKEVNLKTVEAWEGLFDWFTHKVTGSELNQLTTDIQEALIYNNSLISKTIKEFGQIYLALESLDKNYIQSILIAFTAAEEASSQAKSTAQDAKKNTIDIRQTIEVQKKTINVLNKFKNDLDSSHLKDIDEIWADTQKLKGMAVTAKTEADAFAVSLKSTETRHQTEMISLNRKLKLSYLIAGSSLGITITNIVLSLTGIL